MYVIVNRDRCTGLGICESIAPGHFEIDDHGELTLLRDEVDAADRETLDDAVRSCPTTALRLVAARS